MIMTSEADVNKSVGLEFIVDDCSIGFLFEVIFKNFGHNVVDFDWPFSSFD